MGLLFLLQSLGRLASGADVSSQKTHTHTITEITQRLPAVGRQQPFPESSPTKPQYIRSTTTEAFMVRRRCRCSHWKCHPPVVGSISHRCERVRVARASSPTDEPQHRSNTVEVAVRQATPWCKNRCRPPLQGVTEGGRRRHQRP